MILWTWLVTIYLLVPLNLSYPVTIATSKYPSTGPLFLPELSCLPCLWSWLECVQLEMWRHCIFCWVSKQTLPVWWIWLPREMWHFSWRPSLEQVHSQPVCVCVLHRCELRGSLVEKAVHKATPIFHTHHKINYLGLHFMCFQLSKLGIEIQGSRPTKFSIWGDWSIKFVNEDKFCCQS